MYNAQVEHFPFRPPVPEAGAVAAVMLSLQKVDKDALDTRRNR